MPSQALVDTYSMCTWEASLSVYDYACSVVPIINTAACYDQAIPYVGRDARFYASIYYNCAVRFLDHPNGKNV